MVKKEILLVPDVPEQIVLGSETLTINEALALWLWLLAEDDPGVQTALRAEREREDALRFPRCEAA